MNFFVRKCFDFLLSNFVIVYLVCFYDVNETNINYEKLCFSNRGATPAAGFSKKNFQGRGLPQKW